MNNEFLFPVNDGDETAECCDLYGEFCYPCEYESSEEARTVEELASAR